MDYMMCCLHRVIVSEANFNVLLHLGKLVTLRDFTNIVTNLWLKTESHGKDLQAVISKPGTDKEHNILGIFYQDKQFHFRHSQRCYSTHKLNSLRMSLYVFLICDENGQSEIIAACLVVSEERAIINEMIGTFQKYNVAWTKTKVIMTDKDITERDALTEAFPDATLQLCPFYVLRSFGRELTIDAMSIRSADRSLI